MPRPHQEPLSKGSLIGDYSVEECIGTGGFGITYICTDRRLGRKVAVKECFPYEIAYRKGTQVVPMDNEADIYYFQRSMEDAEREASSVAALHHPSIIEVYTTLKLNGTCYIVMKLIHGSDMKKLIDVKKMPTQEDGILKLVVPILQGLECVHLKGLMHRDIKPANIMMEQGDRPVIVDFGAARNYAKKRSGHTQIRSAGYAPIEQYEDHGVQGPWTDIYAVGAVIYTLITGKAPVRADFRAGSDSLYKPLTAMSPAGCSREFLEAVDWALMFERERRPQYVGEWLAALCQNYDAHTTADYGSHPDIPPAPTPASGALPTPNRDQPPRAQSSSSGAEWTLRFTDLENGGRYQISFDAQDFNKSHGRLILGRAQRFCDFAIPNDSLSRQHASIILHRGQIYIEDRNSTNGTFVDGQLLSPFNPTPIGSHTQIQLGVLTAELA